MISLENRDVIALFLFLREREDELDGVLQGLYQRLQRDLFEKLSIEEMESLEDLYQNKIEVLKKRGYI
ncbi:MAG TPA: hypothetical protein ENN41_08870 [Sediminispirochaeta sp.]|nr:hypothetical protein [Sediminispirochaeta sp.]